MPIRASVFAFMFSNCLLSCTWLDASRPSSVHFRGKGFTYINIRFSRFYLVTHPLHRLMVQFRANGSQRSLDDSHWRLRPTRHPSSPLEAHLCRDDARVGL